MREINQINSSVFYAFDWFVIVLFLFSHYHITPTNSPFLIITLIQVPAYNDALLLLTN